MPHKPIRVEMKHSLKQQNFKNNNTRAQYNRAVDKFSKYLVENGMKYATVEQAREMIQLYMQKMHDEGYAAATQKANLAGICNALNTSMADYHYDSAQISTRGRTNIGRRNEMNERVVDFAERVGIREKEYSRLTGKDFIEKDGNYFVHVEKGKGGKTSDILIRPEDVDLVKSYFENRGKDERIFTKEEMTACEHANLHRCRREHAQELYEYYANMGPEERKEIIELIRQEYAKNPMKEGKFKEKELDKTLFMRGQYREEYIRQGKDPALDRFAVRALSVLHLAHYRDDVVCHHYLI